MKKIVGQGKDSLITEGKEEKSPQVMRMQSLTAITQADGCPATHQATATLEGNFPPSRFFFLLLRMLSGMEYLSGQFGSSVPAVSSPHFLCIHRLLTVAGTE